MGFCFAHGAFGKGEAAFERLMVFFRDEKVKDNAKINISMAYWKLGIWIQPWRE